MDIRSSEDVLVLNAGQLKTVQEALRALNLAAANDDSNGAPFQRSGFIATQDSLKNDCLLFSNPAVIGVNGPWAALEPLGFVKRSKPGAKGAPPLIVPGKVKVAMMLWQKPHWLLRLQFENPPAPDRKEWEAKNRKTKRRKDKKRKKKRPNRYIWKSAFFMVSGGLPGLGKRR